MEAVNFIVREPLLDTKGRILGYGLTWQAGADYVGDPNQKEPNLLINMVAARLHHAESGWLLRDTTLFLDAFPSTLDPATVALLPPAHTVFALNAVTLSDTTTLDAVKALREQGYGISIKHADMVVQNRVFLPLLTHMEVRVDSVDMATQSKL